MRRNRKIWTFDKIDQSKQRGSNSAPVLASIDLHVITVFCDATHSNQATQITLRTIVLRMQQSAVFGFFFLQEDNQSR